MKINTPTWEKMKIRGLMLTGKVLSISSFFTFLLICVNAAALVKSTNYTERISKKKKKKWKLQYCGKHFKVKIYLS